MYVHRMRYVAVVYKIHIRTHTSIMHHAINDKHHAINEMEAM